MLSEAYRHRMSRGAAIDSRQFMPPVVELFAWIAAVRRVIDGAVHFFAKRIDRIHRFTPSTRQKEKGVVKIAPAPLRHGLAIGLSFRERHTPLADSLGRVQMVT